MPDLSPVCPIAFLPVSYVSSSHGLQSFLYLFDSLDEVREITAEWIKRYNQIRPHDALGSLPPARYRERLLAAETPV
jgi:transposase InsO family protein